MVSRWLDKYIFSNRAEEDPEDDEFAWRIGPAPEAPNSPPPTRDFTPSAPRNVNQRRGSLSILIPSAGGNPFQDLSPVSTPVGSAPRGPGSVIHSYAPSMSQFGEDESVYSIPISGIAPSLLFETNYLDSLLGLQESPTGTGPAGMGSPENGRMRRTSSLRRPQIRPANALPVRFGGALPTTPTPTRRRTPRKSARRHTVLGNKHLMRIPPAAFNPGQGPPRPPLTTGSGDSIGISSQGQGISESGVPQDGVRSTTERGVRKGPDVPAPAHTPSPGPRLGKIGKAVTNPQLPLHLLEQEVPKSPTNSVRPAVTESPAPLIKQGSTQRVTFAEDVGTEGPSSSSAVRNTFNPRRFRAATLARFDDMSRSRALEVAKSPATVAAAAQWEDAPLTKSSGGDENGRHDQPQASGLSQYYSSSPRLDELLKDTAFAHLVRRLHAHGLDTLRDVLALPRSAWGELVDRGIPDALRVYCRAVDMKRRGQVIQPKAKDTELDPSSFWYPHIQKLKQEGDI